jgi:lysine/ornithine N-monooxygenase
MSPTEEADIWSESLPFPVQFALNVHLTKRILAVDKPTLDGLTAAGFDIYKGIDAAAIVSLYYTRGRGYYIDVGCSRLIAEGKIKAHRSPDGIRDFKPHALVLADGTELEADVVVLATGYDNMRTTVREVLGDQVADRCKDVWDLDEEGELKAVSTSPEPPVRIVF